MENSIVYNDFFFLYLLLIIFITIIILSIKNNVNSLYMNKNYTTCIKGVMAISIFLGHISQRISNIGYLGFLKTIGLPAVTAFLFISGYVEMIQFFKNKDLYFKNFFQKKFFRIYIPHALSILVFILLFNIKDFNIIIKGFLVFKTIFRSSTYNWFVIYLLYFYICNYFSLLFFRNNDRCAFRHCFVMAACSFLWLILCIVFNAKSNWYYNSFTPLIGIIFAYNKDAIVLFFKDKKYLSIIISFVLMSSLFSLMCLIKIEIIRYIIFLIDTIFISSFIFVFSYYYTFKGRLLSFLGNISYEFFLYGTGVFVLYYLKFEPNSFGLIPILFMIVLLSYLSNKISSYATKKIIKY